ncbi:MAG: hypothetical protein ACI36V_01670 [Coriobacteriales bacterium]
MSDVVEQDWKLYKTRLPQWQEAHMGRLLREYAEILGDEAAHPSERFWALDERLRRDKESPGVVVERMSRSSMHDVIVRLVLDGIITMEDLDGFSEDVAGYVELFLDRRARRR